MVNRHGRRERSKRISTFIVMAVSASTLAACGNQSDDVAATGSRSTLRVGVAQLFLANPTQGVRQLSGLLSLEGLARPSEDGRMQPWLAESWTVANNGRSVLVKLRPNVKFHDGTLVDAETVARLLPDALRSFMGPVFSNVESVTAVEPSTVQIIFRYGSPFLREALEAIVRRPGATVVSTGAFATVGGSTTEMRANADYYLGRPSIEQIHVETFPSVRTAWAEMLRDRIDMLWEVGSDALDSMQNSTNVAVFTYRRHYQYVVIFNRQAPALRAPEVRRALASAIDRNALVREALHGHGVASSGPVSPQYWALAPDTATVAYDPQRAVAAFGRGAAKLRTFTCLVSPDSLEERIALELKRQLAAVGVTVVIEEASRDQIVQRAAAGNYDAAITDAISGPSLFRLYSMWHSGGATNWGNFGNPLIDRAFDAARDATSEDAYRQAVAAVAKAFVDDPPAIFLAWSVRARAISKRFTVQAEEGRDVLSTIRLWKPTGAFDRASRN